MKQLRPFTFDFPLNYRPMTNEQCLLKSKSWGLPSEESPSSIGNCQQMPNIVENVWCRYFDMVIPSLEIVFTTSQNFKRAYKLIYVRVVHFLNSMTKYYDLSHFITINNVFGLYFPFNMWKNKTCIYLNLFHKKAQYSNLYKTFKQDCKNIK